ncbi:glycosyltransferase family 2 protein [Microgenomates group bacterium]|nr:glycosyltransferase family 2 protein [Microgenomates group bacterium]
MLKLFKKWIIRYPNKTTRLLEIIPGLFSWNMILFPIWGSFLVPEAVAVYVITFTVYWLWRSLVMALGAVLAHFKIKKASQFDWMEDLKTNFGAKYKKVHHAIIIPTYQEPLSTLERTLNSLTKQTFPLENLHLILAFEEREGKEAWEKAKELTRQFKGKFGSLSASFHPDIAGEVKGKSSNTSWGGKQLKRELVDEQGLDINNITVTCEDADVLLHKSYFAYLTYSFLTIDNPYNHSWQGGIVFYNNVWQVPAPIRVVGVIASINQMYILTRRDRLINFSTYSTTLKHVDEIGYWDTDVIPEDYHMFFKSYFAKEGKFAVEPIFLPIYADMPESKKKLATFKNQYEQLKRWAWGVSDDVYLVRKFFIHDEIPFWQKFIRVIKVLEDHLLWPVNWFAVTVSALLPPLLNSEFNKTTLGKTLPQVSSTLLTIALMSMIIIFIIDALNRPKRPENSSFLSYLLQPFEFLLAPIVGFFYSALPGIDAHTRLMMGKKLEYKVTEKV